MSEKELQYIWENRLFESLSLGPEQVEVIATGKHNHTDGPDFTQACLRWGGITWHGDIELHLNTADWYAHKHQHDPNYNNIILHITPNSNPPCVTAANGREIPTAQLLIPNNIAVRMQELSVSKKALRCSPEIQQLPAIYRRNILDRLLVERWQHKLQQVALQAPGDPIQHLLYQLLLRYLGAHRNNNAMEQVARSLPIEYLNRHADNLTALEAMLLGQAGALTETPRDEYEALLLAEYKFYKNKFGLTPIPPNLFKYLRVRPATHPSRMLAIAATLIHHKNDWLNALLTANLNTLQTHLQRPPSPYWLKHYDLAHPSARKLQGLGPDSIRSLIINALLPTAYIYHQERGNHNAAQNVIEQLQSLAPEKNSIGTLFANEGLAAHDAGESQALLHLYNHYCSTFRCLYCPICPVLLQQLRKNKT